MTRIVLSAYLSSTSRDLAEYRQAVIQRLSQVDFLHIVAMEEFGAQSNNAVDLCKKYVEKSDLFIGIIGQRRGWEPASDTLNRSITELEYDWAKSLSIPCFIYLTPDDMPVPASVRESDEQYARQQSFRSRVTRERVVDSRNFGNPSELAASAVTAVLSHIMSGSLISQLRPDLSSANRTQLLAEEQPSVMRAIDRLGVDEDIDLLELARSQSAVNIEDLMVKLLSRAQLYEKEGKIITSEAEQLFAQSAEYYKHIGSLVGLRDATLAIKSFRKAVELNRSSFEAWEELGRILYRQGDLEGAKTAFDELIAIGKRAKDSIGAPPIINATSVSATEDKRRLKADLQPFDKGATERTPPRYAPKLAPSLDLPRRGEGKSNRGSRTGRIFISYRRSDTAHVALSLYQRLEAAFGKNAIFIDVDTIPAGADFKRIIETQVAVCEVVIALIGDAWTGAADSRGMRRLDDPEDFVRMELASALGNDIPVIPVIVDRAQIPSPKELPSVLQPLVTRQAVHIRHESFGSDTDRLIRDLKVMLAQTNSPLWGNKATVVLSLIAIGLVGFAIWSRNWILEYIRHLLR